MPVISESLVPESTKMVQPRNRTPKAHSSRRKIEVLTFEYPYSSGEIINSTSSFQGGCYDGDRRDEVVGESVIQISLQVQDTSADETYEIVSRLSKSFSYL